MRCAIFPAVLPGAVNNILKRTFRKPKYSRIAKSQMQPETAAVASAAAEAASPVQRQQQQQQQAVQAPAGQPAPGKCHFYLARKRRHCNFDAVPGKQYCGNHLHQVDGTAPKRVPCPWDPKGGHTVLESELEKHKHKCPGYQLMVAEQQQPHYRQDVNAGPGPEVEWPAGLQPQPHQMDADCAADGGSDAAEAGEGGTMQKKKRSRPPRGPALMQAAYAAAMGEQRFRQLLRRVEEACDKICEEEPLSVRVPPEAQPFLVPESATMHRPFSLKHAQQQASIVGNMKAAGLLEGAEHVAYVEYGAGKGYLSCMLSLCCPEVRKLVLMDVRGFKAKADRGMRHLDLQRLRCDIKDFDVAQVRGLEKGAPWVALGKHLCGAATDFTLRSCARERRHAQLVEQQAQQEEQQQPRPTEEGQQQQGQESGHAQVAGSAASTVAGGVRGLAVATCCHHRCSWRHFVAQDVIQELGFSPQEFEVIVWMTGWALCGHEVPAGFGGSDCEAEDEDGDQPEQQQQDGMQGTQQQPAVVTSAGAAGSAQRSHKRGREEGEVPAPLPSPQPVAVEAADRPLPDLEVRMAETAGDGHWRPQLALARDEKIAVGQRCKRLIDAARLRWLRRQGFDAHLVKYVARSVSGENRLLLATAH